MSHALNKAFAEALGLPPDCYRATLQLEAGEVPKLTIESRIRDGRGRFEFEQCVANKPAAIKSIRFRVRLEPLPD